MGIRDGNGKEILTIQKIEELGVFKKAHELTLTVYQITRNFPQSEKFGIVSQLRRAASSICANLAEGAGRGTRKELRHFAQISKGSSREVAYFLKLAADLEFLEKKTEIVMNSELEAIQKMLYRLIQTLSKE
ncbi:MAG: four helix bundle protein [Acidobacteria bacterium]|nr:four helix bundle protein [Acidobacteriota bacterium]